MRDIQIEAMRQGYKAISFVGRRKVFDDIRCEKIGNIVSFWIHVILNTVFDRQGYGSYFTTKKLVRRIKEEEPDIIHLHNLHGYYLNLKVLFSYLNNEFGGKIFWTFHDCWPFTGHCSYFVMTECKKWMSECNHCPSKKEYPISLFFDSSQSNYRNKKDMFSKLRSLTIITPSIWMEELVKKSFFANYPIKIISNGIDLESFFYNPDVKVARKFNISEYKKILLGVANIWDKRKGIADFLLLSQGLSDEYQIVLVGVTKRQMKSLPSNIIGIEKTENINELVALYSMAHIFINPSLEESFSLVTVEAFACGTPVIVLDTSAVKELVCSDNGIVLSEHSVEDYKIAITAIENAGLDRETVAKTAEKYSVTRMVEQIVELYG